VTFSIDDPWAVPGDVERVVFMRATDGSVPRLPTSLAAMWDDEALTLVFSGTDDLVVATHREHDAPLYQEDVVEAFLSPAGGSEYFELEVNPLGTIFDARIVSLDGVRPTMQTDISWTCERLFAAVRRVDGSFDTVMRIPFASLKRETPREGEEWRGNFFRIDRHPQGDEYSAWCPTRKTPADFHVVVSFGVIRF